MGQSHFLLCRDETHLCILGGPFSDAGSSPRVACVRPRCGAYPYSLTCGWKRLQPGTGSSSKWMSPCPCRVTPCPLQEKEIRKWNEKVDFDFDDHLHGQNLIKFTYIFLRVHKMTINFESTNANFDLMFERKNIILS